MRALKSFFITLLVIAVVVIFCWLMFTFAPYSVLVFFGLFGFAALWGAVYEAML